ncbi:MAG: hypothetical protein QW687_05835, partial [Candidatus Hadarchaeales archaeon]
MSSSRGISPLVATILLLTLAIAFGITILASYLAALAPAGPPPRRVSLSLIYENSPPKLILKHQWGDYLFGAFLMRQENRVDARTAKGKLENWKAIEVRVNGAKLSKDRVEDMVLIQENLYYQPMAPIVVNLGPGDEVRLENWKIPLKTGEIIAVVYLPTGQTLVEMVV